MLAIILVEWMNGNYLNAIRSEKRGNKVRLKTAVGGSDVEGLPSGSQS